MGFCIPSQSGARRGEQNKIRTRKHLLKGEEESKMASICKGKSSWPELIGADGKCAAATIERENSLVEAIIVLEGSSVIENFRCDRVWVWVDKDGIVYLVPVIG